MSICSFCFHFCCCWSTERGMADYGRVLGCYHAFSCDCWSMWVCQGVGRGGEGGLVLLWEGKVWGSVRQKGWILLLSLFFLWYLSVINGPNAINGTNQVRPSLLSICCRFLVFVFAPCKFKQVIQITSFMYLSHQSLICGSWQIVFRLSWDAYYSLWQNDIINTKLETTMSKIFGLDGYGCAIPLKQV